MNKEKLVKKIETKQKDVKTTVKPSSKPSIDVKDSNVKLNQEILSLKEALLMKENEIKQKDLEIKESNIKNQQNIEKYQRQIDQLQLKLNQTLQQNEKLMKALEQYDISPTKIVNNDNIQFESYSKLKQNLDDQYQKMKNMLEQKKLKYQESLNTLQTIQND